MAGGKDGAVITDQGNFVIDLHFREKMDLELINQTLNNIPGIIAHGLFLSLAGKIIVGQNSGIKTIS